MQDSISSESASSNSTGCPSVSVISCDLSTFYGKMYGKMYGRHEPSRLSHIS